MKKHRTLIIAFAVLAIGAAVAIRISIVNYFKDLIPAEIGIRDTVLVDGDMGGLGTCGVAVFQLDNNTLEKVRNGSVLALTAAKQSRKKRFLRDDYEEYTAWNETPYTETGDGMTLADRWLGGMVCANISYELSKNIDRALRSPNSYYAKSNYSGLIVIPSLGVVAYIYFS